MRWQDSIKDATYTSPSGKVFAFGYNSNLSSEVDLKTATFTFPEKDGALVVPLGFGEKRFSMSCFFYGDKCFEEANDFEEGLKERGYGELQHPIYGIYKVVPTGTIKRVDDVVAGLNVSQIDVVFAKSLVDVSVINSEIVTSDKIDEATEQFKEKSTWEFLKDILLKTVKGAVFLASSFRSGLRTISDGLKMIASVEKNISTRFQTIQAELFSSIDDIANSLENVAFATVALVRLPSECMVNALAKIEGYSSVAESLIKNFRNDPANLENAKNQWASTRLQLESLVVACSSGVANTATKEGQNFKSREEAINSATAIMELFEKIKNFEESKISKNFFVETGEGFNAMLNVVMLSIKSIIEQSFSLSNKKIIVLDRDRQLTELVIELYGNLDRIDEFILDNKLTYAEIELLPMGREVVYYE